MRFMPRTMALRRQYTSEERSFMVLKYAETHSLEQTRRLFVEQFPDARQPSISTISRNCHKYHNHGTSLNRNSGRGHSGPRTVRTEEGVAAFRQSMEADPHQSKRRNNLGVGRSSFTRLVREIKFHPYKLLTRHGLVEGDHERRLNFCHWFIQVYFI